VKKANVFWDRCLCCGADHQFAVPEKLLRSVRDEALEESAKVAENGRFLHAESLDAMFGRAVGKAIRALKSPAEEAKNG
jgi:hypothetical protein